MTTEIKIKDLVIDDEYGIITETATIVETAQKMKELGVPDLVVTNSENKVLGIVADFDIVQNVVAEGKDPAKTKATQAMYTIAPVTLDTPVTEAFNRMQKLNVNVVPVIEKDTLLGVATLQDCWNYIPEESEDDVGLIVVSNPRMAELWLAGISVVMAFLFGIIVKKAPGAAGVAALVSGPIIYGLFQNFAKNIHFLIQVGLSFAIVIAIMALITMIRPLAEPKKLPVREDIEIKTAIEVKIAGACVIAAVAVFYVIFW